MELLALALAVLSLVALSLFALIESETRGLVALLFAVALTSMVLIVDGAPRLAALVVWLLAGAAIPLLVAVHLSLRLSREERGARRMRPQGVVALLVMALFVVELVAPHLDAKRAPLDDALAASRLVSGLDLALALVALALVAVFLVVPLASRRQV